mgnify:CR=1 FL=1
MKHKTMKELPHEERPYERCVKSGPEHLSDAQLLAVILRTGSARESVLELAARILELGGPGEGILGLLPELMSVKGIGQVKAIQLQCIGELSRRIWKRKAIRSPVRFNDPAQVAEYYQEDLRHKEQEEFHMMLFNTKQNMIGDVALSKGTVNASLATPREIFIQALKFQAVSLILVHNHPSGDPEPSREDILLTRRVEEAGRVIGIPVLDHIIIGDGTYVSMKERGL